MNIKVKIAALTAVLLLIPSCGDLGNTDGCGYTWRAVRPPSKYIDVIDVDSWEDMPEGKCRTPNTLGCHTPVYLGSGVYKSTIHIDIKREVRGQCSTRMHELRHANGEDHGEHEVLNR